MNNKSIRKSRSSATNPARKPAYRRWLSIGLFASIISGHCADTLTNSIPKLKPVPPCPALVAAAQANHIPIGQMDLPSGTNSLSPGDSVTVLVTFVHKEDRMQWLLYLEADTADPKDKPEDVTATFAPNSGKPVTFHSKPAPAKLRLLGPFAVDKTSRPVKEKDARITLDKDFLGLGLDQAVALELRLAQMTNSGNAQLTTSEQRILYGQFPALLSYVDIVQQTEGLHDLLFKLVELPSVWSMMWHGVHFYLSQDEPAPANPVVWNLPASADAYYSPWLVKLNGQPALNVTLVVTSPQPPLMICSGVVGILAEKVGDNETYMTMRVVNAHRFAPGPLSRLRTGLRWSSAWQAREQQAETSRF